MNLSMLASEDASHQCYVNDKTTNGRCLFMEPENKQII